MSFIKQKINRQLLKLQKYYLSQNTISSKMNKLNISRLSKHIVKIHSYEVKQSNFSLKNFKWVMQIVMERNYKYKDDIISALKIMSKVERRSADLEIILKDNVFLTWNMLKNNWQEGYDSGFIGNYVWDLSTIINYVNSPAFSDTFLESYIKYGGRKPTIVGLYANTYYIQVMEAIMSGNLDTIIPTTQKIISENSFQMEAISAETFSRLGILGYEEYELYA